MSSDEFIVHDFDLNFLNLKTRTVLEKAASIQSNCVIKLEGDDILTIQGVASFLAQSWLPFSHDKTPSDLHYCSPVNGRWLFDDIDSTIIDKLKIQPIMRHVFIIENSETFTARGWDKLLKIFEDPITEASFILCFSNETPIPKTIEGRFNEIINLGSTSTKIHVDSLVAYGYTPLNAKLAWESCSNIASLALVLAKNSENSKKLQELWDTAKLYEKPSNFAEKLVQAAVIWDNKDSSNSSADLANKILTIDGASVEVKKLVKVLFMKWLLLRENAVSDLLRQNVENKKFSKTLKVIENELALLLVVKELLNVNVSLSYIVSYYTYANKINVERYNTIIRSSGSYA